METLFGISTLLFFYFAISSGLVNEFHTPVLENHSSRYDEHPLILTSLIKQGKIEAARAAAEVKFDEFKNIKSYSGYFTVNEQFNTNLFFWFFPSKTNYGNAPILLWLEGGPGGSTLIDIFMGNGPFEITDSGLELGKYPLTESISVIYIDNPAGVGYSFTDKGGYARNQTIVRSQLYEALLQFFQLFSELQSNPFFVGGISYAGKYVPAISYAIHKNNPFTKQKINLQGLAIGNGIVDPIHQTNYAEYLYQVGLIDWNGRSQMQQMQNDYVMYMKNSRWVEAYEQYNKMILGVAERTLFNNITDFQHHHNYLKPTLEAYEKPLNMFMEYIERDDVRAAIHVANTVYYAESNKVYYSLAADIPQPVAIWLSELLNHYQVLIYNGQLDVICAYPLTVNYIKKLQFPGAEAYKTASRHKWYVNTELAGYMKQAGNLVEVLVRNASHSVQFDQPRWLLDLLTKLAYNNL